MRKLTRALIDVLGRLHGWMAIILLIDWLGPLESVDEGGRGRLQYAFLMLGRRHSTRRWFARLLRRERRTSVENRLWLAKTAQCLGRLRLAGLLYRQVAAEAESASEVTIAKIMAEISDSMASRAIYRTIAELVNGLGLIEGEPVVLVPVGSNFAELFQFWLEQARKHVDGRIVGVALDTTAVSLLRQELQGNVVNLSPFFVFGDDGAMHPRSKDMLWILRVLLLREIVARGHTVTSLDLDTLVLEDLGALLGSFPEADIVAQQDYSLPLDVARKLGFILCCGFMVFRPTQATQSFLDRYAQRTILESDDQMALNHLIAEAGIRAKVTEPRYLSFEADGVRWLCPDQALVSRDIAYGSVVRHFQQKGQTVAELRALCGV